MIDPRDSREFLDWIRKNYMEPMLLDGLNDIRNQIHALDLRVSACEPPAGREAIAAKLMPSFLWKDYNPKMAALMAVEAADLLLDELHKRNSSG